MGVNDGRYVGASRDLRRKSSWLGGKKSRSDFRNLVNLLESAHHVHKTKLLTGLRDGQLFAFHHTFGNAKTSKVAMTLLFQERSSELLASCVDTKGLFNGEELSIKMLKRFHNRFLMVHTYTDS